MGGTLIRPHDFAIAGFTTEVDLDSNHEEVMKDRKSSSDEELIDRWH